MVPLLGENRYLVKQGLKLLNTAPRLGIKEMLNQSRPTRGNLDTDSIAWVIAPRLNTTGRLEHALSGYKLLITDSPAEAQELSSWLERKNAERQRLTERTVTQAREQILAEVISPILIAGDKNYPPGIIGLAAGRLTEEFYRPTVIISTGKHTSMGSCRSIPEFNIINALKQCRHLFTYFGGHPRAAGFTIPTENLGQLKQQLLQIATTELAKVELRPRLSIDAEVDLSELGGDTFPAIQRLAPFGCGNPAPVLLSRRVEVISSQAIGANSDHLKLRLRQSGTTWEAIAFRVGNYQTEIAPLVDIVYNLEVDHWRGEEKLRLNITDFAPINHQ